MGCGSSLPTLDGLPRSPHDDALDVGVGSASQAKAPRIGAKVLRTGIVSSHSEQNEGFRPTMEDSSVILPSFADDRSSLLLAILDGHGGTQASVVAAEHLPKKLAEVFTAQAASIESIQAAFTATEAAFAAHGLEYEGTTATVALITHVSGKPELFVAWLGDSSAVLSRSGTAMLLTLPHNCEREDERARVTAAGGFVARGKVNGLVSVSRCFGNLALKPTLSPMPDVVALDIQLVDECLIVACDGLWDVVSPQSAVDFANAAIARGAFAAVAQGLVQLAIDAGSTDNVSVIVANLRLCFLDAASAGPAAGVSA